MVQLVEAFAGHDTFYYCYDAPTTRALPGANVLVPNMARNPLEFLRNLWRAWRTFRERRPDLIVSTGAEIAIPLFPCAVAGAAAGLPWPRALCGQPHRPAARIMNATCPERACAWPGGGV
jgi:hypothetical protein